MDGQNKECYSEDMPRWKGLSVSSHSYVTEWRIDLEVCLNGSYITQSEL
jgi:hypothetical protein